MASKSIGSGRKRATAGTRGGLGRIVAMAVALAAGLLLALAGEARGQVLPIAGGLTVAGGEDWRPENDFDLFWTNPAEAQIVGAYWKLVGPSFGPVQYSAAPGISELDHLAVPAPGAWNVYVWLQEASGFALESFASTVTLRFDDAPPAISFMPGDTDGVPAQLVAAVADPLSGLADGTISYRRLDETRWSNLPTAIRAGVFGTELAATPPELRPGTAYLFQAEARDNAGNLGTTTMRADGSPMEVQAPPESSQAGGRGPGGRGAGSPGDGEGQRTRLLVGLAGGRQERGRVRATVAAGESALLRGALLAAGASGDGRRLRITIRPARGSRARRRVERLSTGPDGRFELRLPPGPSRRITVAFAGDEQLRPARRRLELRVRAAVSLWATPRELRTGGRLRLEGRVASRGARVPRAGKLVTISYWEREARRWRPVIVTRTDRSGRFRTAYRFRYVTGRARIRLRAAAPAEAQWPYAPGTSRPLTIEVHG